MSDFIHINIGLNLIMCVEHPEAMAGYMLWQLFSSYQVNSYDVNILSLLQDFSSHPL